MYFVIPEVEIAHRRHLADSVSASGNIGLTAIQVDTTMRKTPTPTMPNTDSNIWPVPVV